MGHNLHNRVLEPQTVPQPRGLRFEYFDRPHQNFNCTPWSTSIWWSVCVWFVACSKLWIKEDYVYHSPVTRGRRQRRGSLCRVAAVAGANVELHLRACKNTYENMHLFSHVMYRWSS